MRSCRVFAPQFRKLIHDPAVLHVNNEPCNRKRTSGKGERGYVATLWDRVKFEHSGEDFFAFIFLDVKAHIKGTGENIRTKDQRPIYATRVYVYP